MRNKMKYLKIVVVLMIVSLLSGCNEIETTINVDKTELDKYINKDVEIQGFMGNILSLDGTLAFICNHPYSTDINNSVALYLKNNTEYIQSAVVAKGTLNKASKSDYDLVYLDINGTEAFIEKKDFNKEKESYCINGNIPYEYVYTDGYGNIFKYKLVNSIVKTAEFEKNSNNYKINHIIEHGYPGIIDIAFRHIYSILNNETDTLNTDNNTNWIDPESVMITKIATDSEAEYNESYSIDDLYTLKGILEEDEEIYSQPLEILNSVIKLINRIDSDVNESNNNEYNKEAILLYETFIEYLNGIQLE